MLNNYIELFNKFSLTVDENKLIIDSHTNATAEISQVKIISDLYTIKNNEQFVKNLVSSNEQLTKSNNRYALALNILTGALVLTGILQIVFS